MAILSAEALQEFPYLNEELLSKVEYVTLGDLAITESPYFDEVLFSKIYKPIRGKMIASCRRREKASFDIAADIVDSIFEEFWKMFERSKGGIREKKALAVGWLWKYLGWRCIDRARLEKKEANTSDEEFDSLTCHAVPIALSMPLDMLEAAFPLFTPMQKEVAELYYFAVPELKQHEIAERLGVKKQRIWTILHKQIPNNVKRYYMTLNR